MSIIVVKYCGNTLLHTQFSRSWQEFLRTNSNSMINWTTCGVGATCLIFERNHLIKCIEQVKQHWYEDISLDWMYRFFDPQTPITKLAFHIGKQSSRFDSITRIVEQPR